MEIGDAQHRKWFCPDYPNGFGVPMGPWVNQVTTLGKPGSLGFAMCVGHRSEVILEYQELVEGKDLSAKIAKVSRMQLRTSQT